MIREIENVKEFERRTKKSKSTIYRFYKKNTELWDDTILKGNKRLFPVEHAKYFDSEIMYDENKVLRQQNHHMRNLIDHLMDKDSFLTSLWYKDWTYFVTVAYKAERNKTSCFKQMNGLYDYLIEKYGSECSLRMFFTTEPFTNRTGYHNHFVINISKKALHQQVMNDIEEYFQYDKVDVDAYNRYEAAIFYSAKGGLVNEDWNIMGNKLADEGIKLNAINTTE